MMAPGTKKERNERTNFPKCWAIKTARRPLTGFGKENLSLTRTAPESVPVPPADRVSLALRLFICLRFSFSSSFNTPSPPFSPSARFSPSQSVGVRLRHSSRVQIPTHVAPTYCVSPVLFFSHCRGLLGTRGGGKKQRARSRAVQNVNTPL